MPKHRRPPADDLLSDRLPLLRTEADETYRRFAGRMVTIDGEEIWIITSLDVLARVEGSDSADADARDDAAFSAASLKVVRLLEALNAIQAEEASVSRSAILKAMMLSDIDPVPAATVAQAQRLARQRDRLLASGAHSMESLRELRGDAKTSTTRTWVSRRRATGEVFTVAHDGGTLLPAFQLDDEGNPLPALRRVLRELAPAELGGWATWTWFTSSTPWLSGAVPIDVLASNVDRVVLAARRFATTAA